MIRRRALVVLLRNEEHSNIQIQCITGLSENTIISYVQSFLEGGIEQLTTLNYRQPESQLRPFDDEIKKHFTENPVATIAQACEELEHLTGVRLKPTQVRDYLNQLGIKYRKVSSIPAKANPEAQQTFHDELLQPRLDEAKANKRAVFFVDAAHFVFGAFLGYLWSLVRVSVRTPSGRQRFNVLGALNAITKELHTITNFSYITSTQICELLHKLKNSTVLPITLVLDNARYQRCAMVMELAKILEIELLFLPPYSPNLNLIERLWKMVKNQCLYSRYYQNFTQFHEAISTFLDSMHTTHQKSLQSLLTLKFHLFTDAEIEKAA
jgi:transposase